jgi:hypothetical protein
MPTTPEYGWDTPADTDYVTNGALSIRTLGNDIDATVYSIQTTLDAEKVDKAGDTMTGALVLPNITAANRALGIKCDSLGDSVIQFLNITGASENGYIKIESNDAIIFYITQNGNSLQFDNIGNTTRTHDGETRPIPFAIESGRVTLSGNTSSTISLNSNRFTQIPLILITPERNSAAATAPNFHSGNRTTSNFKIYNNDSATWVFNWQAVQMTSTDSEG